MIVVLDSCRKNAQVSRKRYELHLRCTMRSEIAKEGERGERSSKFKTGKIFWGGRLYLMYAMGQIQLVTICASCLQDIAKH